ncbi:MAG: hypothetical protein COA58_05200 [Bacteroidetes bacterium]|nr:MAG: hypothetical protein COA58_05200 [Bacteroidota bacterium]
MLHLILSILLTLTPNHDFHTSWMNLTYDESKKEFNTTWRIDTEHLEGALAAFSGNDISLENTSISGHKELIDKYINDQVALQLNNKNQALSVSLIEVTFAETIVYFEPINCRKRLKKVGMHNTLLQAQFPNQKNMVQINYKGNMYSMLLGGSKVFEEVEMK